MLKKFVTLVLAGLLTQTFGAGPVFAGVRADKEPQSVEQIKIKVARAGTGEKARVTVRLKDGTKLKGYVSQAEENNFVVRDRKTDAATTVRYEDVAKVDINRGHSTARNVTIGVAIGAGAFLLILLAAFASLDD